MPARFPDPPAFLIGAAIGSGGTALAAQRGGADFLVALNAGRLRNMGVPSIACMLPIFDASALTERFACEELLPQCRIPVLLGIDVWGETLAPEERAERIAEAGFAGAVNFPSCMHYSHAMQQLLARAGRGIEREVEQLRKVQDRGLVTMFYCATRTQARLAADAGLNLVCLNLGWNVGGALGHRRRETIEEVAIAVREIGRLIKRINPRTRFLLEGGPIASAEDLGRLLALAPIDGYVGGSTFERMPLESSVADQLDRFRHASRRSAELDSADSRLVAWAKNFGFVGQSKAQIGFLQRLRALAESKAPVLVLAETGLDVGASLKALASGARQRSQPPVIVHIDMVGEDFPARARALLFGQSDSTAKRRPALGDGEIDLLVIHAPDRLPTGVQRRLARALGDGFFQASGSRRPVPIACRVAFVATGRSVASAGLDSTLADLLAGWSVMIPPIRDRIDDLLSLAEQRVAERMNFPLKRRHFSAEVLHHLSTHLWPGNDAELDLLLGHVVVGHKAEDLDQTPISLSEITPLLQQSSAGPALRTEKERLAEALWRHGFSRSRTAEALGISRKTLYNKIQKYGLAG